MLVCLGPVNYFAANIHHPRSPSLLVHRLIVRVCVCPCLVCSSGVQEVTLMENEDECVLYLNSRLGFVKLAMQFGVPIVPVFSFGLRKSYSFWAPKSKIWANIGRKIGFLPMMIFGMWGLPMGPPKECEYTNVIGRPIPVPQIAEPTQEDVKKYHALYVEALTALFEKNKARCGMAQIKLRIA